MDKILKVYYIIIIYICFGGTFFFHIPAGVAEVLAIGFIWLSTYETEWKLKFARKDLRFVLKCFVIPILIIFAYSIVVQLGYRFSSDYLVRTSTVCLRMILYIIMAIRAISVFRKDAAPLMLVACIVVYLPVLLEYFLTNGIIVGILALFSSTVFEENISLEVHRLTYVFGFITVFFFYRWIIYKDKALKFFIISLICTFLGMKRIATVAVVLIILLILLSRLLNEKFTYKIVCVASLCMIGVAISYVYLIRSDILKEVFANLNVSDSFRFNFWDHFKDRYQVSPLFFGYGLSYAHRTMWHEWTKIHDLTDKTNLHNDVLGYYLGFGFIGSIMFWCLFFYKRVKHIKKNYSTRAAIYCFMISLFYFIIMCTSNEGMSEIVNSMYFTTIFICCVSENTQWFNEERNKQSIVIRWR